MPKVAKKSVKKAPPVPDEEENARGSTPDASAEPEVGQTSTPDPVAKANITKIMKSDVEMTRAALAKDPQVHFLIPLALGEKVGAFEDVWINGFHTRVPKGVMSIIPKGVADLLANKYKVEAEAGKEFRLDLNADKADVLNK